MKDKMHCGGNRQGNEQTEFKRRTYAEAKEDLRQGILDKGPGFCIMAYDNDPHYEQVRRMDSDGKWHTSRRPRRWHLCDETIDIIGLCAERAKLLREESAPKNSKDEV